jgi:glycosyltransferase involved in cell wall biosynthesis
MHWQAVSENNMSRKMLLSAIILTKNEEARIAACLDGVSWADELIVIDNGSTDKTVALAAQKNAAVIREAPGDFSRIRNTGAHRAKGEWLLYVDADETVTPELRDEIKHAISSDQYNAYFIPRKNYYLGHVWPYRDGMVRLIRKRALVSWRGILHEHPEVKGKTGKLEHYFIHRTHRTLEEMVIKTNEWSAYEAELRFHSHHPLISWWRIVRVMITSFFDSYISQEGWKAGTAGLIESMYQAFSMFITYAKLWEMQKRYI